MARDTRFFLKPHYSTSRALVIGINQYTKASPLSFAVNDAEEFRKVLIDNLSFPDENVRLLKDNEATRDAIYRAYLNFAKPTLDLDERIIVFFAGHGHTIPGARGEVGYLVPSDGDPSDPSTLLRWDDFTKNADLIRAKHMLFIMDACYGGLALTRNISPGSTRFLKDMMRRYSRQVLTAGKADEVVADSGGPLPSHSVFTGHLLEGLRGKAHSDEGILTANGLMSYVYGKVASDKNSQQTPHYGSFDGDGDFILFAPQLKSLAEGDKEDLDALIVLPFADEAQNELTTKEKVRKIKGLLASESSAIELHDFIIEEVRRFLSTTNDDHFKVDEQFTNAELARRIDKYEHGINDLSVLTACISHWERPWHKSILQKALCRSMDYLKTENGLTLWLALRWYPIIVELYCSGIAALAAGRFDSLADIFYAKVGGSGHHLEERFFAQSVAEAILALNRGEVFKQLPGRERQYTPMSEHLHKMLQPRLDDLLFLGTGYERVFDEFEVFFALTIAYHRKMAGGSFWGPIGRFGWKQHHQLETAPLTKVIAEANAAVDRWEPIKAGLFGGSYDLFDQVAKEYSKKISGLSWS